MLKCIIFDMDGTIADTLPLCIAAFRRSVEFYLEKPVSAEEIVATFGASEEGTMRSLIPDHIEEGTHRYWEEYRSLHETMCPRPFNGMPELIQLLKDKGLNVALVTGKGPVSLDITLEVFHMKNVFDAIEPGSPLGPNKPACLKNVLKQLHLAPDETLYIGDTSSDILATRAVSIPIISVAWASTVELEDLKAHNPDYLCYSVDELRDLLLKKIAE
ncbi:MAG: HAD family hydrolase [Planctomycetaceae bacterium]|jgi:phosphoglycolate phosphatase/pyrophosphatase PpaX|nr:HAD family hydrolase [Planctomycetaceae bacterium]